MKLKCIKSNHYIIFEPNLSKNKQKYCSIGGLTDERWNAGNVETGAKNAG